MVCLMQPRRALQMPLLQGHTARMGAESQRIPVPRPSQGALTDVRATHSRAGRFPHAPVQHQSEETQSIS